MIRYVLIFGFISVVYHGVYAGPAFWNITCIAMILLFGVPHGAADHKIHATIQKNANVYRFVGRYILIAAGYILWWVLMPGKALIFFLIMSAYHFGQEFLEDTTSSSHKVWEIMIWGGLFLFTPMLIAYPEIKPNIETVAKTELPEISKELIYSLIGLNATACIAHLGWLKNKTQINPKQLLQVTVKSAILLISFRILPFILAFTMYFILFHSMNAFKHQYHWLKSNIKNYNLKSFLKDLSLFSGFSIVGIIGLLYFVQPDTQQEFVQYFFILISIVTLPHSILFDQFYKFRNAEKVKAQ